MALAIGILSMLVALIPVFLELWKGARDRKEQAVDAVRTRDRLELRDGIERVRRLWPVEKAPAEPVPPGSPPVV